MVYETLYHATQIWLEHDNFVILGGYFNFILIWLCIFRGIFNKFRSLDMRLDSHSASLHPGVQMCTGKFNHAGNPGMDYPSAGWGEGKKKYS